MADPVETVRANEIHTIHPLDERVYACDFAELLDGATLAGTGHAVTVSPDDGITVGAITVSGTELVFEISGASPLTDYEVTVAAARSDGRTVAGVCPLRCRDQ